MQICYPLIAAFSVFCFLLIPPPQAQADCSCSIGGNGIYVIGYEFIATSCPSEPPSDDHSYTYNVYPVNCVGGTITKYSSYGDISGSPNMLITFYTNAGYRLIRNPSGNHMFAVQNGNYPYQGTVSGLSMAGRPAGVYYTDPIEEANEICTPVSSPSDQDGDGYTICFDCDDDDGSSHEICLNRKSNLGPKPCP